MVPIEIQVDDRVVKVRRFGVGDFRTPILIKPGDVDRLTGWTFEELRNLGNGVWGFELAETKQAMSAVAATSM